MLTMFDFFKKIYRNEICLPIEVIVPVSRDDSNQKKYSFCYRFYIRNKVDNSLIYLMC
jgi:hypothetical protein